MLFYEGIRVLRSFSLIKEDPCSGIYSVHPSKHKWNRDRIAISVKEVMHKVAKLILVHSIPLGDATEDFAFCRLLLVHIKTNYQFQQENYTGKEFDDLEYVRFSNSMQKMHHLALSSKTNLALTFCNKGNFDKAEKLLTQVLNLCIKVLGPEHPDTIANMNDLALNFQNKENLGQLGS